jgi:RimJ/RimL family protein N-acetyltransferase
LGSGDDDTRLGRPVPGWVGATAPTGVELVGRFVTLRPVDPARDREQLFAALHDERDPAVWDYLSSGPFTAVGPAWDGWLRSLQTATDAQFFVLVEARSGEAQGVGAYLRIFPSDGSIEIGSLTFGAAIQRTPVTTEAIYLLARHAFEDLRYRRLEWKCNALNARSRAAAERLGFVYEGIFRQAQVLKGRNRDTAWFSILDGEWPALRAAFEAWLEPENFDADGRQRRTLASLRGAM